MRRARHRLTATERQAALLARSTDGEEEAAPPRDAQGRVLTASEWQAAQLRGQLLVDGPDAA